MKILLINEGTMSSVNDDKDTISHYTIPIVDEKYSSFTCIETQAGKLKSKKRIKDFLLSHNNPDNELIIIRKSKGVKEIHDIMNKDYNKYFGKFKNIKDFAVDGYSLFGRIGIGYGLQGRTFKKKTEWISHDIYNFRQENGTKKENGKYKGWLKGARFTGAREYVLDSTHMDIIRDNTFLEVLKRKC